MKQPSPVTQFAASTLLLLSVLFLPACSSDHDVVQEPNAAAPNIARQTPTDGGIPWFDGSIEEAFSAAKAANKPIFLYWGAEWCPPCHQLKATIFLRDEFIQQSKLFVPVYLDGDTARAQKYGEKFAVYGYPTVIIFDPRGIEITRIPGGMDIQQYVGILELALNALHPVSDLVQAVQAGRDIRDEDWSLLANYSWGQDRGKVLGEEDKLAALRALAAACPDRLAVARSKLQMLALDAWAGQEERDEALAGQYLAQVQGVLDDDTLRRENLAAFIYGGANMVSTLGTDTQKLVLHDRILATLDAAIDDQSLDVLTRISAVYGWVDVNKALLAEDEQLPAAQQAWAKEQVEAARAQLNSYQQHVAINAIWQLYYDAGLEAEARAALQQGMEVSKQPYYFMSGMGYLEKEAGDGEQAIYWYKKAWDAAQGPATRIQWGTNYLDALLELSPDDIDAIGAAGTKIFDELTQQTDGLHHRSSTRMDRLSTTLLAWAEPAEDDSTTGAQRQVVLRALRREMDRRCEHGQAEGEGAATCESFLIPAESA